jgi:hypothetical protein
MEPAVKTTDTMRALKAALKRESATSDAAYLSQAEVQERHDRRTTRNAVSALMRTLDDQAR